MFDSEKDLISFSNSVNLGDLIYTSLKPTNQFSSVIDYQITQCTAAESLTLVGGVTSTDGLEYDLITVRIFSSTLISNCHTEF